MGAVPHLSQIQHSGDRGIGVLSGYTPDPNTLGGASPGRDALCVALAEEVAGSITLTACDPENSCLRDPPQSPAVYCDHS